VTADRRTEAGPTVHRWLHAVRKRVDGGTDPMLWAVTLGGLALVAGCGLVIAKLLDDVLGGDDTARVDPQITSWFVAHRTASVSDAARWVTHLGDPLVVVSMVVSAVLVLVRLERHRLAVFVAMSSVGAAIATGVAKSVVGRARPPRAIWEVAAAGAAFPSGHATQSIACYGAIAVAAIVVVPSVRARKAVLAIATLVALSVGVSRVYLGVHWTSDVLCGWAVAALWLATLVLIGWARPRVIRLRALPGRERSVKRPAA